MAAAALLPVALLPRLLSFVYSVAPSSDAAARQMIGTGFRYGLYLLSIHAEAEKACLCRVRVHFYKNIYYFGYFIPKNVQNARYFAFFAQNIWQYQKNVLPLHRI